MSVPLLDLSEQHEALGSKLRDAFAEVLKSGQFIMGPYVERFERDFAQYIGVKHCIGVASGTDALLVAMMAMDIGPGDEVITTPFTFFATAGSIARLGAIPVFVDIIPQTYNLDIEAVEAAITKKTKAIMPVHLFGLSARMADVMKIAKKHKLKVIEDAAQACGAAFGDKKVGSIGDVGCFSFYPTKILPAIGDGGAVTTNDDKLAEKIRWMRNHGADKADHFPVVGGNFRLDALQAAILSVKLPHLDQWIARRREIAERYEHALEEMPLGTPFEADDRLHVYNQYTVRVHGNARDKFRDHLAADNIGSRVYYPTPLHLQPCFKKLGYKKGRFPDAEEAAREVLSIPCYPEMTDEQQDLVIQSIRHFFRPE